MSKEAFYFSHDYNSRNDPRLMRVLMKNGVEGIGIYWCIIEMLYEQNGYIPLINIESIAFELHTECERIKSILQDFDLFKFKDDNFYSISVLRRLRERNKKSEGARQSALKRWYPDKYKDAKAMRTQSDSNAIKERKGKERKGKKYNNIPPTFEEINLRFKERQFKNFTPELFFSHYETNGWKVGSNKMKNWDSALTYWEHNNIKNENNSGNNQRRTKSVNQLWNKED